MSREPCCVAEFSDTAFSSFSRGTRLGTSEAVAVIWKVRAVPFITDRTSTCHSSREPERASTARMPLLKVFAQ